MESPTMTGYAGLEQDTVMYRKSHHAAMAPSFEPHETGYKIKDNVHPWEARHPLEARHDPCSRWRYLFPKYLTPSAAYRVAITIKKKRTTMRINLHTLGLLLYFIWVVITDFTSATPGYPS